MPGIKDLLKKKDKIGHDTSSNLTIPEFTFIRTTTESEEIIQPPSFPGDDQPLRKGKQSSDHKRNLGFRLSSNAGITKDPTATDVRSVSAATEQQLPAKQKGDRRLSARLHISGRSRDRSRSTGSATSANLPDQLPEAPESVSAATKSRIGGEQDDREAQEQKEAQWEKRATMLAMHNPLLESQHGKEDEKVQERSRSPSISDVDGDINIQEAIRLHEAGELTRSTHMFGQLANPEGANNALAQVLYGLALRHGWGVEIEPAKAIYYLSLAASSSASIEEQALSSGMRKGGAAKGELVLAIFELANCFRHGWGVQQDAVAARQYYETAANLGDTDALEEAAWCYMEGFGGSKDKFKAAQYLRSAEQKGGKSVGNSWIWKDKYNPK